MSRNESTVESATQLLSRKLGAKVLITGESFAHRVSAFNRLNFDYALSSGREMSNSPETISAL
jgi:hypothetical protein